MNTIVKAIKALSSFHAAQELKKKIKNGLETYIDIIMKKKENPSSQKDDISIKLLLPKYVQISPIEIRLADTESFKIFIVNLYEKMMINKPIKY